MRIITSILKCYKRISINMAKSGNNINRSEQEGRGETLTKKLLGKTNHSSPAAGHTLQCIVNLGDFALGLTVILAIFS